jgi:hypothetical protein
MKLKIGFSIFILLLINTVVAYAQVTVPDCGDGTDPDGGCPLDTWVIVLVAVFSLFAVYRLHQRKKTINKPSL